jgi:hypothetical protein
MSFEQICFLSEEYIHTWDIEDEDYYMPCAGCGEVIPGEPLNERGCHEGCRSGGELC